MALREAGLRVVNLACGLGRPDQHQRRRGELEEACARAGFELRVCDPPVALSAQDDLGAAQDRVRAAVVDQVQALEPVCVVGPSPHDRHHGHETVGRGVRDALAALDAPPPWLVWEMWAALPLPTVVVEFDADRLAEIGHALGAHAGELDRVDYRGALEHRARTTAILGGERVFGFGSASLPGPYAEVVCEVHRREDEWWASEPRLLDPRRPLDGERSDRALGRWLEAPSFSAGRP